VASSPSGTPHETGTRAGSRFFFAHRVWLWGFALAWLTTALVLAAEYARIDGLPVAGDLLDIVRLAAYWFWCRLAWRAAGNAGNPLVTLLSKAALAAGLVATVLV
jgi:hypothetical protein